MSSNSNNFSDFIVYVDESGDHSLTSIDPNYPIFVLAFCIFEKHQEVDKVESTIRQFKFHYFGHDLVILHENEIRKEKNDFNIFKSKAERIQFMTDLTDIIEKSAFSICTSVIGKKKLQAHQIQDFHAYHFSLKDCLETLFLFIQEKQQADNITYIIVESRGNTEDKALETEFLRICNGENQFQKRLPFQLKLASKQINSAGLQIADLVARPIGLSVLKPEQNNRAMEILKPKIFSLKCFPSDE